MLLDHAAARKPAGPHASHRELASRLAELAPLAEEYRQLQSIQSLLAVVIRRPDVEPYWLQMAEGLREAAGA
jgi:hypothetical protein